MSASSYDAVVVGAGPAGSIAAVVLARAGARVALVDKSEFPRDKACGDLVGPRGVQVLNDLGLMIPGAPRVGDLLTVGPSGRRSRLPTFPGRTYPDHAIVAPRHTFDHSLREAAVSAGAIPIRARVTGIEREPGGPVRAVMASDGQRLAASVIIGADGAISQIARLTGMVDPASALWGFAVRAYVSADVPLPLLVISDARPWRIYPGYGWLFPGEDGQANVGIGVGLGASRRPAPLRDDLERFCSTLRERGDLPGARIGPVTGGWLRMGGTASAAASGNVLLVGDAAGLINPLQGEGIGPAMVSARLAAEAVLAGPSRAASRYTETLAEVFGRYMPGAAALQRMMLQHPGAASATMRMLTAPGVRHLLASTWALYWNGLTEGSTPRPAAWAAHALQAAATRLAPSQPGGAADQLLPAGQPAR